MKNIFDPRLYLVTDRKLCLGRDIVEVVLEAVHGGVTVVQLREKNCATRDFVELGRALRAKLEAYAVPLIINDRADVALACGAAGIHLGQADLDAADARRILGPGAIIGLSIESLDELPRAQHLPITYFAASPVFATPTKTDTASPLGLSGVKYLRMNSTIPIIGIGGIQNENVQSVIQAGAHGVAVVSAICSASSPRAAAQNLKYLIDKSLTQE